MSGSFTVDTSSAIKGGVYSSPTGDREFSVPIYCYTGSQQDDIDSQLSAKKLNGHWVSANTGTPFDANEHFRVIEFNGTNWRGIATTYDQNIGEEDFRQRIFQYCLLETNGTQILCGHLGVMTLAKPSTNIMYDVLTILKSVEFVKQYNSK
ncbi:hypothetical protein [Dyella acidiphila]|uniref:Uncharacterized protein n=1 Tax=Dyella acidiphila TaxID=2775866 RepID=A0ABR9GCY3_9GAMM|nr:hypothetical protein [Dyella acidiphila]MBE1161899.1 hypothetical protein [Dyella acidiphila]